MPKYVIGPAVVAILVWFVAAPAAQAPAKGRSNAATSIGHPTDGARP